ncbi:beta strand repeat-containing protein [Fimbriiglobus ruber]|uniref:Filamentous hemagglutinin-like protein n=1 Tax=Fimbriiglobus ruber TaxID=1908690 RepID=A0A225E9R0_9BACT|nr:FG-GAP-like repeat-containing protein [Fimbriiglobus ruber]OWK47468.1 Filamentous hemagglutinin-like protein [Fimbriiglobus ruber]
MPFGLFDHLEDRTVPAAAFSAFVDPHPSAGDGFGAQIVPLSTGNVVITAPQDNSGGADAGAVYLFSGVTGALISSLIGSHQGDEIGSSGIIPLANGNFVIVSPNWSDGSASKVGAVTFGSGETGASGVVNAANSLVGSTTGDQIGSNGVTVLSNGNYLIASPDWSNGTAADAGAMTFGNGATGIVGTVSAANSLVGSTTNDQVGGHGVTVLSNGNYVVASPNWSNGPVADAGAMTFGSGTTGIAGAVSAANSLVGSSTNDFGIIVPVVIPPASTTFGNGTTTIIGSFATVIPLMNGNYVVSIPYWSGGRGAVAFGTAASRLVGVVGPTNSLVGTTAGDYVGAAAQTVSSNKVNFDVTIEYKSSVYTTSDGNYIVVSSNWSNASTGSQSVGAVTYGNGTSGVVGAVSSGNSLLGSTSSDSIGSGGVTVLSNNNYVVSSPNWSQFTGAVTFLNEATGTSGSPNAMNSLVGDQDADLVGSGGITVLSNGNYVVSSPSWASRAGAVTFGSRTTGVVGNVSASNSLVGTNLSDQIGSGGITVLDNSNYVVSSPNWFGKGAVTFGNGVTGVVGVVGATNSLVGNIATDQIGSGGVTALETGNYVINSPDWTSNLSSFSGKGAVTFASGTTGLIGTVDLTNSLVGTNPTGVLAGVGGITALSNGNYVVSSPDWTTGAAASVTEGAVTFGNGTTGVVGVISVTNSLVGTSLIQHVGGNGITALDNSNYLIQSLSAVTFGNGTTGVSGLVSPSNTLLGGLTNSLSTVIGTGGVSLLGNGYYVVYSPDWSNGSIPAWGAITIANDTNGAVGITGQVNSLIGSDQSERLGASTVTALGNGNYLVTGNPKLGAQQSYVSFVSGSTGVLATTDLSNTVNGTDQFVLDSTNSTFYVQTGDMVRVGSQATGYGPLPPPVSPQPALVGTPQFAVGSGTGGTGTVTVYNPDQSVAYTATPFGSSFTAGVRVAVADLTGAASPDLIAATGPGVANQVVVVDGTTHQVVATFSPFESTFTGGLYVTTGDLNGDGIPDVIVTPDQGGGPVVAVYDGAALGKGTVTQVSRFFGINDPSFRGGARAAVGDVNGDGTPDLIVSAGDGGGPRVAVYNGATVPSGTPIELMPDFFAFENSLRNGVYVTSGDVTGGGYTDLVFGAGPGGGPRVRVVNPQVLLSAAGNFQSLDDAAVAGAGVADFFAGDPSGRDGVPVAVKDLDGTDQAGLVTGAGSGSTVTGYTGAAMLANPSSPTADFTLDALPGFTGGVFVG